MTLRSLMRLFCVVVGIAALGAAVLFRVRARQAGEPFLPLPQEAQTLRALTWNIGKIYMGNHRDSRAADEDLAHIARVIRGSEPDFVALQELRDRSQLEHLLGILEGRYHGHVPEGELNDRRVAVLVRARPGVAFTQVVTSTGRAAAIARIPVGSFGLTFVSVHLDAFDPRMRRTQAEELVDWAQRIEERNVILAGDFNFDADFLALHEPGHPDVALYRLLTSYFQDAARTGRGTTIVDRRLDYVFTRGRLRRRGVQVLDGQGVRWMDHMPVLVDFDLTRTL